MDNFRGVAVQYGRPAGGSGNGSAGPASASDTTPGVSAAPAPASGRGSASAAGPLTGAGGSSTVAIVLRSPLRTGWVGDNRPGGCYSTRPATFQPSCLRRV